MNDSLPSNAVDFLANLINPHQPIEQGLSNHSLAEINLELALMTSTVQTVKIRNHSWPAANPGQLQSNPGKSQPSNLKRALSAF